MAWRSKDWLGEYGSKKDGSGTWWKTSSGQTGREATRRRKDGSVTHYAHRGKRVVGWEMDRKGNTRKFRK